MQGLKPTDVEEIKGLVSVMKSSKGGFPICSWIGKEMIDEFSKLIVKIVNKSFEEGCKYA